MVPFVPAGSRLSAKRAAASFCLLSLFSFNNKVVVIIAQVASVAFGCAIALANTEAAEAWSFLHLLGFYRLLGFFGLIGFSGL